MCMASGRESVQFPDGLIRYKNGEEVRPGDPNYPVQVGPGRIRPHATDVPLRDGMVGEARESILSRRERIRRAVEGEDANPHLKRD